MDILLLVIVIILALVLIGVNIYLLAYYSHPDDEGFGVSIWPKIIAVLGLTLAFAQILILPLDVSNSRGQGAGMRIDLLWQILFISVAVYIVLLAPFSLFYYEAEDEEETSSKICHAVKMELFLLVIMVILFCATYFFFAKAEIPVEEYAVGVLKLQDSDATLSSVLAGSETTLTLDVSFPIYIIAVFSWIGWWLFVIYAGVGITALPLDMIIDYKNRPIRMKESEFVKARLELATELVELKKNGEQIRVDNADAKRTTGWWAARSKRNAVRDNIRKYEIQVLEASRKFELLKLQADFNKRVHPICYCLELFLGFIFIIVAIIWMIHMYFFKEFYKK